MNRVFLRSKIDIKKINIIYLISLIPLIIYGLYKNGIKLYYNDLIRFSYLFKPIIILLLGFVIGVLVEIISCKIIYRKKINNIFLSFYPLYGILIGCMVSINTKLWIFSLATFLGLLLSKILNKIKINYLALILLIIMIVVKLTSDFTYLNIYEQNNLLDLNIIDYLIGRGSGGISTTCIILLIISYLYLLKNNFYKKEIPITCAFTFGLLSFVYSIIIHDMSYFYLLFNNGILFSYLFIASDLVSSPYTLKGKIIYSVLIGVLTFVISLKYPLLASLLSIFICSVGYFIINKIKR